MTFPTTVLLAAALAGPVPIIDNEQVRATITTVSPHQTMASPRSMNCVLIYLDAGTEKLTHGDGRVERRNVQVGDARWSPAGAQYTSENTGGKPFRVVQVEAKGQGHPVQFGALDPVRLAPQSYKVLIDNVQVRVLRARIGPKQGVPLHEHALNRVVVFLTDAHLRVTDDTGKVTEATAKAGDVRWSGIGKHSEENIAGVPFDVVAVEVK